MAVDNPTAIYPDEDDVRYGAREEDEEEEDEDEDEEEAAKSWGGEVDPQLIQTILPSPLYNQCASLLDSKGRGFKQLQRNLEALTFHLRLTQRFQHKAVQHDLGAKKIVSLLEERFHPLPKKNPAQHAVAQFLERLPRRILNEIARSKGLHIPKDDGVLIDQIARVWSFPAIANPEGSDLPEGTSVEETD